MPQSTLNPRMPQIFWFNPAYPTTNNPLNKPGGPSKPDWPLAFSDVIPPAPPPVLPPAPEEQPEQQAEHEPQRQFIQRPRPTPRPPRW
jgi:hypothetical protein